jgi:hypothetical protein
MKEKSSWKETANNMATKRVSQNELAVSAGASAAAPARRKTAAARRPRMTAEPVAPPATSPVLALPSREEIALLAYSYWEARGCQGGSPENDWIRAEQELSARATAASAASA